MTENYENRCNRHRRARARVLRNLFGQHAELDARQQRHQREAEPAPRKCRPVNASGSGSGSIRVAEDGSVSGSVTTTGVQGTMAHIHQGAKGANGPVIVPLTKSGDTYTVPAGAKLNAAQMSALKAGNLYVNVHTNANKGGEVRGQLNP